MSRGTVPAETGFADIPRYQAHSPLQLPYAGGGDAAALETEGLLADKLSVETRSLLGTPCRHPIVRFGT
jgi:hypothetical protein